MTARDFMMMFIGFAALFSIGGMFWLASFLDREEAKDPDWPHGMGEAPRERA